MCELLYLVVLLFFFFFFFSSRRRHTRLVSDWSSDVCSSDLWMIRPQRDARDEDDDEDASMEPLFDDELEPEPEAFAYDDFIDDEVEPEFGDVDDEPEDEPAKKARVKRPRHVKVPSAWVLPPLSLLQRTRDQKLDPTT